MNYYRSLNEGLDRYIERELEEDNEEILDERIFGTIKGIVKDKIKNDHFYYINDTLLGSDSKAEKTFWNIVNNTNMTQVNKDRLKAHGEWMGKPLKAKGKNSKGEVVDYYFSITTQPKEITKKQDQVAKETANIVDDKGKLKPEYMFSVATDKDGKVTFKLGNKDIVTYPNKETAKNAFASFAAAYSSLYIK